MRDLIMTGDLLDRFLSDLKNGERSENTVMKYGRDLRRLAAYLDGRPADRDMLIGWKRRLQSEGMAPCSVNSALSAVNGFVAWAGRPDLKLGFLKVQRRVFRNGGEDLTKDDYSRLVATAYRMGRERLGLMLEAMGSTGIRVSELKYITVEAARSGRAEIDLKNKLRVAMLSEKLCVKLRRYARENHIMSGPLFLTRNGQPLSRQQAWRELKDLAARAGIPASKVYPHNLRHMFATVFYSSCGDIVKLADVLGHSSIDTTRIYLISSGREHAAELERLDLVT